MSSSEGENVAAGLSETGGERRQIGYCHVCDRQVPIDDFTCQICHSGFVELFDMENQPRDQEQPPPPSPPQQQTPEQPQNLSQRVRVETFRFNESSLPQFMSQLLTGGAGSTSGMSQFNRMMNMPQAGAAFEAQGSSRAEPPSQPMTRIQRIGPTTRLQFIVPGEQFDLYGIINNVLGEILDPRRQAGASFSFQPPPMRMFQLHGDMRDYAWGATGLDSIITQLLNQLENTGPPPANDVQIQTLPEIKVGKEEIENNLQCSICMEDFKLAEIGKKLPCKHVYHETCIVDWLKLHGTCPVCRMNLNGEDTSQREYISRPPTANQTPAENSTSQETVQPQTPTAAPPPTPQQQQQQQPPPPPSNPQPPPSSSSASNNTSPHFDMDFD